MNEVDQIEGLEPSQKHEYKTAIIEELMQTGDVVSEGDDAEYFGNVREAKSTTKEPVSRRKFADPATHVR